jgi:DNA-binding MarR family transcriptional regulator
LKVRSPQGRSRGSPAGSRPAVEEPGLVERAADPGDRRRHSVRLTPAGEVALGELRRVGAEAEEELLAPLDEGERQRLQRLLVKLLPVSGRSEKNA